MKYNIKNLLLKYYTFILYIYIKYIYILYRYFTDTKLHKSTFVINLIILEFINFS